MSGKKKKPKKDGFLPWKDEAEMRENRAWRGRRRRRLMLRAEAEQLRILALEQEAEQLRNLHARLYYARWPLLSAAERVTLKERMGAPQHPIPRNTVREYKRQAPWQALQAEIDQSMQAEKGRFDGADEGDEGDDSPAELVVSTSADKDEDDTSGGGAGALAKKADAGGPNVGRKRKQGGVSDASGNV